jgi:hypothetical protein
MNGFMLKIKVENNNVVDVEKIHYKLNEFYQPEVVSTEEI